MSDSKGRFSGRALLFALIPVGFILIIAVLMFSGFFANPEVDVPAVDDPASEATD